MRHAESTTAFGGTFGLTDASQAESTTSRKRKVAGLMPVDQSVSQQRPRQQNGMSKPQQAHKTRSNGSSRHALHFASASGGYGPAKWQSQVSEAVGAGSFWEDFSDSIHLLCLSEIKYAMMAQSVVGVPGVMTLLCNLSTTINFGPDTLQAEHPEVSIVWLPSGVEEACLHCTASQNKQTYMVRDGLPGCIGQCHAMAASPTVSSVCQAKLFCGALCNTTSATIWVRSRSQQHELGDMP
jgi:hypothetical protein